MEEEIDAGEEIVRCFVFHCGDAHFDFISALLFGGFYVAGFSITSVGVGS